MYIDQFGDDKLMEFALWLEHTLGAIRLEKRQVRYQTAQNFLKSSDGLNLLDVIANSYFPQQVIDHLRPKASQMAFYSGDAVSPGKGVQGIYKQAVINYFAEAAEPGATLGNKVKWIKDKLAGQAS